MQESHGGMPGSHRPPDGQSWKRFNWINNVTNCNTNNININSSMLIEINDFIPWWILKKLQTTISIPSNMLRLKEKR